MPLWKLQFNERDIFENDYKNTAFTLRFNIHQRDISENGIVETSKNMFFHINSTGKNGQNQLFQNSGN